MYLLGALCSDGMVPYRVRPCWIVLIASDHMDVKLRSLIPDCSDIKLGRLKLLPHDLLDKVELLEKLQLIFFREVHDPGNFGPARDEE